MLVLHTLASLSFFYVASRPVLYVLPFPIFGVDVFLPVFFFFFSFRCSFSIVFCCRLFSSGIEVELSTVRFYRSYRARPVVASLRRPPVLRSSLESRAPSLEYHTIGSQDIPTTMQHILGIGLGSRTGTPGLRDATILALVFVRAAARVLSLFL